MEWFEAVLLGLLQGLTEFLPVSSSGHLEIGKTLLGVETSDDLLFTTMVHAATVLLISTKEMKSRRAIKMLRIREILLRLALSASTSDLW